jgi:MFS family permease
VSRTDGADRAVTVVVACLATAMLLTAGAIADRFGRRRLFILGVAIFTASSALCGAAGGIEVLVGARAIQGLGASMMFATALALISQVTPNPKDRVNALAAYGAAIGASFALGPFIGGSLTELFGWRASSSSTCRSALPSSGSLTARWPRGATLRPAGSTCPARSR